MGKHRLNFFQKAITHQSEKIFNSCSFFYSVVSEYRTCKSKCLEKFAYLSERILENILTNMKWFTIQINLNSEIFYVRNNHPVPVVDVEDYHLCITGIGVTPTNLTLSQLKASFARKTITSVLQCAGSRRAEMDDLRPVAGTKWGGGAVGNAFWTGADFKSVLAYASFDLRNYPNLANIHVQVCLIQELCTYLMLGVFFFVSSHFRILK